MLKLLIAVGLFVAYMLFVLLVAAVLFGDNEPATLCSYCGKPHDDHGVFDA